MYKGKLLVTAALALAIGATSAVAQAQGDHGSPGHAGPAAGGMHGAGGQSGGGAPGGAAVHNNSTLNAPAAPVHSGSVGTVQPNRDPRNTTHPSNGNAQMPAPRRQVEQMQPHGNGQISRERSRSETTGRASQEERRGVVEQRGGGRITNEREINERSRAISEGLRGREPTTTGQGAASARGAVNLSSEQRARLHEIFAGAHGPRLGNADFDLAVGHRIPRSVRFVPVPETVYEIEPAWRGYDYFAVANEIVIVDPLTLEIIAVIDV
jgi:Protein of unknown function (DUF1236)